MTGDVQREDVTRAPSWWVPPIIGGCFGGAVANAVLIAALGVEPHRIVLFVIESIVGLGLLIHRRYRHGRNRRTEENPQDPDPFTINITADTSSLDAALKRALARTSSSGLATGGNVKASTPEPPPIEQVESDMPILAHRIARLMFDGKAPFVSLNEGQRFGADADAKCTKFDPWRALAWHYTRSGTITRPSTSQHPAPAVGCTCGFYALPSDIDPWDDGTGYVTLMVELSGTVIEHEKGYRAEHQRVVECQIPACPYCGRQAAFVVTNEGQMAGAACASHVPQSVPAGASHVPQSVPAGVVLVAVEDVQAIVKVPVTCIGEARDA